MHEPQILVYKNKDSGDGTIQLLEDGECYTRTESGKLKK